MDIRELMIGNYVYLKKGNESKIYQIDSGFDFYKLDESDCNDIEPILLTHEWLLKIGFEKFYDGRYNLESVDLSFDNYGYILLCEERSNFNVSYRYVHQLQNLYFALTNKHLTTK